MAFELGNFYMCMDMCVASFNMWYCDTKNYCYYFPDQILILKHVIFVLFITCCIKCFQFCVFNSFLLYKLMFWFFCYFRCIEFNCICKVLLDSKK